MQFHFFRLLTATWLGLAATAAMAQDGDKAPSPAFKLTGGLYASSGGGQASSEATDINLRHSSKLGTVWVGRYVAPARELIQDRVGWDRSWSVGVVRIQPSAQLATGGALNGSVGLETGEDWYVGAGLGRTNLRETVNLNFDPNDAYSLSGGYRWAEGSALGLIYVRDNRLNPDQQHLHLVYRTPLPDGHRLTVDLLLKRGLVEDEMIERTGLSVAYDWPRWFLRLSYDPRVNFTPQDMWRLVFGTRF
ncbi:MAG: hypothetical protein Q8R72_09670 [Hylemonella sp.]|nr:hypothetical protein [Hylemonella sp.]